MICDLSIEDMIKPRTQAWERWGAMLSQHPNMLHGILSGLPAAKNEIDSVWKTVAIYHWLRDLNMELIELSAVDMKDPCTLEETLCVSISFQDSPYGTHAAPPLIGRRYRDPDFPTMSVEHCSVHRALSTRDWYSDDARKIWQPELTKAERAYFNEDPQAPFCLFKWNNPHDLQEPDKTWVATEALLSMDAKERRMVSGYRYKGTLPLFAQRGAPEDLINRDLHDFNLNLVLHLPSELLMSARVKEKIESGTHPASSDIAHTRRSL